MVSIVCLTSFLLSSIWFLGFKKTFLYGLEKTAISDLSTFMNYKEGKRERENDRKFIFFNFTFATKRDSICEWLKNGFPL